MVNFIHSLTYCHSYYMISTTKHVHLSTKCVCLCKRMGLVHTLVMSIKPICRYSSTWCRRGKSWSRHQNCKRMGLVHKASVSYCSLGLLLKFLYWCRKDKSWSRHQNCKRIGLGTWGISISLCLLSLWVYLSLAPQDVTAPELQEVSLYQFILI